MSENGEDLPEPPETPQVEHIICKEAQLQGSYNIYGQFRPYADAFPSDDEDDEGQTQTEFKPFDTSPHTEYIPGTEDWERTTRKWTDIGQRYKEGTGFSLGGLLGIGSKPFPSDEVRYFKKKGINFEKELGSGSWGTVWAVSKTTINQGKLETMRMACKVTNIKKYEKSWIHKYLDFVISCQGCGNVKEAVERMVSEAEIHQKLVHKHIVECKYVFKLRDLLTGFPYCRLLMFMDLCDGDLLSLIKKSPEQRFTENQAKEMLGQVSEGLQYMHDKHICHFDIKPENILYVIESGTQLIYKLSDLGIAIELNSDVHILSGQLGTEDYMAPEIKSGGYYIPKPGDIYSLGCVLAQTVVGQKWWLKFIAELRTMVSVAALAINYKITGICADLIFRMTNEDPDQRPTIRAVMNHDWLT